MGEQSKILVVDDTPHNVKLLADLLTAKDYDVRTAASGVERPWSMKRSNITPRYTTNWGEIIIT